MREIDFRGKRSYNKEWVYGSLITSETEEMYVVENNYFAEDGHHLLCDSDIPIFTIQETIGQYTGRKDSNNKKIYEGDIVENEDYIGTVAYSEELVSFGVVYKDMKGRGFMICLCDFDNPKVIGNIYDNPELLEV